MILFTALPELEYIQEKKASLISISMPSSFGIGLTMYALTSYLQKLGPIPLSPIVPSLGNFLPDIHCHKDKNVQFSKNNIYKFTGIGMLVKY